MLTGERLFLKEIIIHAKVVVKTVVFKPIILNHINYVQNCAMNYQMVLLSVSIAIKKLILMGGKVIGKAKSCQRRNWLRKEWNFNRRKVMRKYFRWQSRRKRLVKLHNKSQNPFLKFWVRIKFYQRFTIILAALCCLLYGTAQAADLTISYGKDVWVESWTSKVVKTHALELELKRPYNRWLDTGIAAHTVWSETNPSCIINGSHFGGTDLSLIIAGRLIAHKALSKHVFVEGFGGFGLVFLDRPPEIGPRSYVGNFGAIVGYKFDKWSILYKVDHWSVPFYRGDKGHNRHYIGIRVAFGR